MMSSHSDGRKDLLDGWYPTEHFVKAVRHAELFAQQAKSVLALLAPKDVTETRLGVGRVS